MTGTVTITMLQTRRGEDGTLWDEGRSYQASDPFARVLVADGDAATLIDESLNRWDDLRFPAQAINPAGAAAAPTVDDTLANFPGTLLFSGSAENVICGVAQMPHAWSRGTPIRPHIHWSKPTGSSAAVSWVLYYRVLGFAGDAPAAWVGPVAGTLAAGAQTESNEHLISSFGEIDMTGQKESSIVCWRVHRLGNTDADNNAARLLEFDIHFLNNKAGTANEIPS
jgi:hypothetical protein